MKTACTVAPQLTLSTSTLDCDPPWLPLNGSAFLQYNSTSYNDDMAWAATWMYRCAPPQQSAMPLCASAPPAMLQSAYHSLHCYALGRACRFREEKAGSVCMHPVEASGIGQTCTHEKRGCHCCDSWACVA